MNLGSVRRRGKDGGLHPSWQPWEWDPGVPRQSTQGGLWIFLERG